MPGGANAPAQLYLVVVPEAVLTRKLVLVHPMAILQLSPVGQQLKIEPTVVAVSPASWQKKAWS